LHGLLEADEGLQALALVLVGLLVHPSGELRSARGGLESAAELGGADQAGIAAHAHLLQRAELLADRARAGRADLTEPDVEDLLGRILQVDELLVLGQGLGRVRERGAKRRRLHEALQVLDRPAEAAEQVLEQFVAGLRSEEHTSELQSRENL